MYSLNDYGHMIADTARIAQYARAISEAVRPGDVVADIGCGPGLFALFACRAGAKRVYAIDMDGIVHFARELAAANDLADRMQFIQGDSRKIELPERVNVIVSDIRGVLPFFGHAIPSMEDARQRFLAPGGVVIPQRDTLKATVIEAGENYSRLTSPWKNSVHGLDFSQALPAILNEYYSERFKAEQVLAEPQTWCVLDYSVGAAARASAELYLRATRNGTAHGLCLWFETQLYKDIGFSSGPGSAPTIYGQVFLPWLEPILVVEGQAIEVTLQADLVGGDYIWRWETKTCGGGDQGIRHFRQSTFHGANFAPQSLRRRAADFVPSLSEEGRADRWLLQAMDGKTSLQQIAQGAARQFPKIFPRWEDALGRVADLAAQFSR